MKLAISFSSDTYPFMGVPIFPAAKPKKVRQGTHQILYNLQWTFFFLVILPFVLFLIAVASISHALETGNWSSYFAFLAVTGVPSAVLISLILLMRYLRRIYYYNVQPYRGPFPHPITNKRQCYLGDYESDIEDPSKCRLCGRHPTNKKYHIRKVHKIGKDSQIEEYFLTCGCDRCLRFQQFSE